MEEARKKNVCSSTTGSMYVTSLITSPNVKSIIQAVSTILHSQMLEDQDSGKDIPKNSDLYFFSEEKYIEEKPEEFDEARKALLRETPSVDNIYEFIKALYDCAQFSPECCIICLVYINRLIAFTQMPLYPTNWRPLILCSLLVAQKVWDDKFLSNADFAFIYPFFVTEEINRLEAKFLELLQYKVTVKSALYAKYYFELRALFKNQEEFPLVPLDQQSAALLESRSSDVSKKEQEKAAHAKTMNEAQIRKANAMINV
ncbi:Cyclin-like protein [Pseudocohnilembus persalinus]|uniref:Cyclin-like protein n=1 Tax=Pseudocohnilembus persalinus TaxID=266149 RepID=A0A0V0QF68_PSEPJ|nr:Cyclin-like protein [Pseudocohnilembus persalinus]|eukprot:KRX00851.1 Cyclin-like protein [Pseudocohnilembus persalinus]